MKTFVLISRLPNNLSCNILRDWLSLKSVMTLDSAYCSKSQREKILSLFRSNEYFIQEQIELGVCSSLWNVLYIIGDKLRSISFADSLSFEQEAMLFQHCHKLMHVHFKSISSCIQILPNLHSTNPHLQCISLSTENICYSSPPGAFLTSADLESSALISFAQGWRLSDEERIEVLKMNSYVTRLEFASDSIPPSTLLQIPHLCPLLTHLGLRYTHLTEDILSTLAASCPQILHLDVADNQQVTDAGILAVVQNLTTLKSLNLLNLPKLTNASLLHISTYCAGTLHTLYISNAQPQERCVEEDEADEAADKNLKAQFTADSINQLLEHCTQLRMLYIRPHNKILFTPAAVRSLTTLVFDNTVVSKRNLATISKYAVNLHTLFLGEIATYSRQSLLSLVHGCPNLKEFCFEFEPIDMHNVDDYDTSIQQFALAFMDLWMQLRPGFVAQQATVARFYYRVMDM